MSKAWSFVWLVIVGTIVLTVAAEAVRPYLPLIGLAVSIIVILAVAALAFKVVLSRKRPW